MILMLFLCLFILLSSGCAPEQKPVVSEKIDRGVVALSIDETHAYVGWRLLRDDPQGVAFNVYRKQVGMTDFAKVNGEPVTMSTNFVDSTVKGGQSYRYRIKKLSGNNEIDTPGEATVFMLGITEFASGKVTAYMINKPYYSIKLNGNINLNRVGIGDLDNDGAFDFVIQSPNFNTDPYHRPGYWKRSPETYKLDAYTSQGKFLWRYDMGWAIETGTWYSPYMVYDIDGDGVAEIYAKAGDGDPRELDGHVLEGPEYLVKIDGQTGKIIQKVDWLSKEGFESYNYWSRNFLTVAYFNGKTPSLVMQRGTYSIIKIAALNPDLEREWYFESTGENKKYRGQGGHGIHAADIDSDGKDEFVPGTFALDDDGKPLWYTGLGHNDAGYISDIDPSHPGMEIFYGIESRSPRNGVCLVDAATGRIIWGYDGKTTHVHSYGMVGDIDPAYPGMECYAGEAKGGDQYFLYSADGKRLSDKNMGSLSPLAVWWDADDLKEMEIDGNLFKYQGDTILTIEGKVLMVADIVGDWREEIVTGLPGELRIYSTTITAKNRKVCLLQNRKYRLGVANTTMGYFYPPQLGIEQ
jgi:rhamnogalacturonan endolyase